MSGQGSPMFGTNFQPVTPPLKGSFPLDYRKECRLQMLKYMCCLKEEDNQNTKCREKARDYFQCRMDHGLMDREEWVRLGYEDIANTDTLQKQDKKQQTSFANRKQREITTVVRG